MTKKAKSDKAKHDKVLYNKAPFLCHSSTVARARQRLVIIMHDNGVGEGEAIRTGFKMRQKEAVAGDWPRTAWTMRQ